MLQHHLTAYLAAVCVLSPVRAQVTIWGGSGTVEQGYSLPSYSISEAWSAFTPLPTAGPTSYEVIAEIAYDEESYVPGSRDEFGRFQGGSFVPIPGQSTTLTQTGTVVADTAYNSFGQGDGFSAIRQVCSQLPDNGSSALCVNSNAQLEGVYSTTVAWVPYSTLAEPAATTAPVNAVERYEDSAGGKLTATLAISMVLAILGLLVL